MNLQENIQRVKQMMGVINEDDKSAKIHNMVDEMGLMTAIKFFGSYDNIVDMYGGDINLTKEKKIDFIRNVIYTVSKKYDTTSLSVYRLGMNPISLYAPNSGQNLQQIEHFHVDFVTIDVIGGVNFTENIGGYTRKYEDLSDEVLDKVFDFMINVLER
jgi:hypothetical protein